MGAPVLFAALFSLVISTSLPVSLTKPFPAKIVARVPRFGGEGAMGLRSSGREERGRKRDVVTLQSVDKAGAEKSTEIQISASNVSISQGESTRKALIGYVESIEAAASTFMTIPFLRKLSIWAAFTVLVFSLKQFYSVALGTFVFALVGNSVVDRLEVFHDYVHQKFWSHRKKILSRKFFAGTYILSLISLLSVASVIAVPKIMRQGQYLMALVQSDNPYAALADGVQNLLGPEGTMRLENFIASIYPETLASGGRQPAGETLTAYLQQSLKEQILAAVPALQRMLRYTSVFVSQTLVSFVFSSIIVYDYPKLRKGIKSLGSSASRVRGIYKEIGPSIRGFGRLISKAFELQFVIAILNTILTALGLLFLGIPGVELLSVVTLICSFVPVVGWIAASVPMGLVALSESGFRKLIQVVVMVFGVHAGLVLVLPALASTKLKLHPLTVLVAMYLAEHFVGVQGLILVIPLTVLFSNLLVDDTKSNLLVDDTKTKGDSPPTRAYVSLPAGT
ncbi:hypothetical protein AAMO2058_000477800 [Amorphochlora amoebiformis]